MAERQPQQNGNGQHGHQGHQGGQNGGHQGGHAQQGRAQDDEQPREHQPRDQARPEPRPEYRAEHRPEPRAEHRPDPAPVAEAPALPDPVGEEAETGPVETPEAADTTEAKPRSRRSSRPRNTGGEETAPRSAPARSRRKPAAAAGATVEAPASPEGSGD